MLAVIKPHKNQGFIYMKMKTLLTMFVALIITLPIQASSSMAYNYENIGMAPSEIIQNSHPTHIPFMYIDLQPESVAHVKKWAKIIAGIGAFVGACIANNSSLHVSLLERLGLIVGGSIISGSICSMTGSLVITMYTDEKKYEYHINSIIQLHNDAYNVYTEIGMTHHERYILASLLTQDFQTDQNRAAVYAYVYKLAQKNSTLLVQCPITTIVDYMDNLAYTLERELCAINKMVTEIPSGDDLLLPSAKQEEIANITKKLIANQSILTDLNTILSPQSLREWASQIRNMPEYNIDNLRRELAKEFTVLQQYEHDIRYKLARLSALHGKTFSHAYLTSTFGEYLWHSFTTDYAHTSEGRRARMTDIAYTKNEISSAIQNYQNRACLYSNKVITFNAQLNLIPREIQAFLQRYNNDLRQLEGYYINAKLLEYNTYLNHNDGDAIWTWVQSCFC
jgi:hypothetical protein